MVGLSNVYPDSKKVRILFEAALPTLPYANKGIEACRGGLYLRLMTG